MSLVIIEQIMTFKSQFELCQVMQTHLGQRAREGGGEWEAGGNIPQPVMSGKFNRTPHNHKS